MGDIVCLVYPDSLSCHHRVNDNYDSHLLYMHLQHIYDHTKHGTPGKVNAVPQQDQSSSNFKKEDLHYLPLAHGKGKGGGPNAGERRIGPNATAIDEKRSGPNAKAAGNGKKLSKEQVIASVLNNNYRHSKLVCNMHMQ